MSVGIVGGLSFVTFATRHADRSFSSIVSAADDELRELAADGLDFGQFTGLLAENGIELESGKAKEVEEPPPAPLTAATTAACQSSCHHVLKRCTDPSPHLLPRCPQLFDGADGDESGELDQREAELLIHGFKHTSMKRSTSRGVVYSAPGPKSPAQGRNQLDPRVGTLLEAVAAQTDQIVSLQATVAGLAKAVEALRPPPAAAAAAAEAEAEAEVAATAETEAAAATEAESGARSAELLASKAALLEATRVAEALEASLAVAEKKHTAAVAAAAKEASEARAAAALPRMGVPAAADQDASPGYTRPPRSASAGGLLVEVPADE